MNRFSYELQSDGESARLALTGELDMAATLTLEPVVDQLLDEGARRITIDLSGLSFIDSTGISLLITINDRVREAGAELRLPRPREEVGRALEVTGVDTVLPLV